MMKVLCIVPGGQTDLHSPSENLAMSIDRECSDIDVTLHNMRFSKKMPDAATFDVIWGDMDGSDVPMRSIELARKHGKLCYLHCEWVPPYRFEKGWSGEFHEPTNLKRRDYYLKMIDAMTKADLVSLALSSTPGGFDWIHEKTGISFKNGFVRYPACPAYSFSWDEKMKKNRQIATIARVDDGKKRIKENIIAIGMMRRPAPYIVIGGCDKNAISPRGIDLRMLGKWNTPSKVDIFIASTLAIQHWSGIPPAEAFQHGCPVLSYDIPYMRELYGDSLVWVPKDNAKKLASAIDEWIDDPDRCRSNALTATSMFINGMLGVKQESCRVSLVADHLRRLFT